MRFIDDSRSILFGVDGHKNFLDVAPKKAMPRTRLVCIAAVFLTALGVRFLYAQNAVGDLYGVEQERYRIAHFYHEASASLTEGDDRILFPTSVPTEETLIVGYPPGYFAVMAAIYRVAGNDMANVLYVQCFLDALCCVVLFLVGEVLFSHVVGLWAGLLMAVSPQFAYLSVVVKPDTMTALPVLLSVLLIVFGLRTNKIRYWVAAGFVLGVACWLRQNALLLAPMFAVLACALSHWKVTWRGSLAMTAVCYLCVAPITIRNFVAYHRVIPVTVGSGFALLSGLARDDFEHRYGLSRFAYNFTTEEAEERDLPSEYFISEFDRLQEGHQRKFEIKHTVLSVFGVDGIERDRERTKKAVDLIASDPVYYLRICLVRVTRLIGYTEQNRPVRLAVRTEQRDTATLDFYQAIDPRFGTWRYYADRGKLYDFLRPPLAAIQRVFVTPVVLVLMVLGLILCVVSDLRKAVFLLAIPVYYIGLQSLMWAEFRHTLPIHATVFLLIGFALATGGTLTARIAHRWRST